MAKFFTANHTWSGGEYELGIELGERNDRVLLSALKALWQHPGLTGCYLRMDVEPKDQSWLDPTSADLPQFPALPLDGCLFGIAVLPNGGKVACRSDVWREEGGADWLYFGLPMGSVATAYPVGAYPFHDGQENSWRKELDTWLSEIGRSLFDRVGFRLGMTGWDACGALNAVDLARDGVPEERWLGILRPEQGELSWYPPTRTSGPLTFG